MRKKQRLCVSSFSCTCTVTLVKKSQKALKKLSDANERIQMKAPGNVKHYLLPPMRMGASYFNGVEDFVPPLTSVNAQAG